MKARALDGETLDALCWRTLGQTAGTVEQVLQLNPQLARLGAFLPAGTEITLPARPVAVTLPTINLWD